MSNRRPACRGHQPLPRKPLIEPVSEDPARRVDRIQVDPPDQLAIEPNAKTYVLGRLSEVSSQIVESRVTEESVVAVTSEVLPIAVHEVVVPPDVVEREGAEGDGRILSG